MGFAVEVVGIVTLAAVVVTFKGLSTTHQKIFRSRPARRYFVHTKGCRGHLVLSPGRCARPGIRGLLLPYDCRVRTSTVRQVIPTVPAPASTGNVAHLSNDRKLFVRHEVGIRMTSMPA